MPSPAKNPPPPPAGHLWTPEAARRIGLTVQTLHNYRHLGKGPKKVKKIGGKLAWPIDALDAWLNAQADDEPEPARIRESRPAEPRTPRRKPAPAAA